MLMGPLLSIGCGSTSRTIMVPDHVVRNPEAPPARRPAVQPYKIKMTDGTRTWQIEIPGNTGSGSFEAVVPLNLGQAALEQPAVPPTEADQEVAPAPTAPEAGSEAGPTRSYLTALATVTTLFRKRQYEMALIELVKLEREFPDDERILEMKGTLYWRLRRPKLAREAWERMLTINPNNVAVAQALENLVDE